jgi:hypothetical protein
LWLALQSDRPRTSSVSLPVRLLVVNCQSEVCLTYWRISPSERLCYRKKEHMNTDRRSDTKHNSNPRSQWMSVQNSLAYYTFSGRKCFYSDFPLTAFLRESEHPLKQLG